MLNTGPPFYSCASLINFFLSLSCIPCFFFQSVMEEKFAHRQQHSSPSSSIVLAQLFICPPLCFSASISDIRLATLLILLLYLFLSHSSLVSSPLSRSFSSLAACLRLSVSSLFSLQFPAYGWGSIEIHWMGMLVVEVNLQSNFEEVVKLATLFVGILLEHWTLTVLKEHNGD